jgi:hypothetical protein
MHLVSVHTVTNANETLQISCGCFTNMDARVDL